ncbi:MAG: FeoC-like transcriptional regulator [Atribacterota bacterium]|nr:FeoC-like transcriptional regulator [Atribacterota bacterium]
MEEPTLLTKVLVFMDQGTVHSVKDIADKLAKSPDLVYHMLMNLEQMGFLKIVNPPSPASEGCSHCGGNCNLCILDSTRSWELTEKGRRKARFAR